MAFEEIIESDKAYVPPVIAETSTVAEVDEVAKKINYNETVTQKDDARLAASEGSSTEGSVYMDLALEATGLKALGSVAEFVDERMGDKTPQPSQGSGDSLFSAVTKTIEEDVIGAARSPGVYRSPKMEGQDLLARANIVSDSIRMESPSTLNGKDKFTETSKWEGKETKMAGVQQVKSQTMQNRYLLENVQGVRREHSAQLSNARGMAPEMSMGSGPRPPSQIVRQAVEIEDWKRRMQEDKKS